MNNTFVSRLPLLWHLYRMSQDFSHTHGLVSLDSRLPSWSISLCLMGNPIVVHVRYILDGSYRSRWASFWFIRQRMSGRRVDRGHATSLPKVMTSSIDKLYHLKTTASVPNTTTPQKTPNIIEQTNMVCVCHGYVGGSVKWSRTWWLSKAAGKTFRGLGGFLSHCCGTYYFTTRYGLDVGALKWFKGDWEGPARKLG